MNKSNILLASLIVEALIIISIAIATLFSDIFFALFYNGIYGILISVVLPLYFLVKSKEDLSSVGIKKIGVRQIIVLLSFVCFSIGGQLIPLIVKGKEIAWHLLPICIAPLIMTTFFEEFLFRGFVQTRVEKHFNSVIAVLVSAVMFSFYHLGYPGFRSINDILLLFVVGLGFALAYKLSDNNLIVSYFVNLPNAFVTYMFKSKQFPIFQATTSVYSIITIVLICIIFFIYKSYNKKYLHIANR